MTLRRAPLGAAAPLRIDELVHPDRKQPTRRPADLGSVLRAAGQRRRERLGRQVGRELSVVGSARKEPQHRVHVTAIKQREGRAVVTCEKFVIGYLKAGHLFAYYEAGPDL